MVAPSLSQRAPYSFLYNCLSSALECIISVSTETMASHPCRDLWAEIGLCDLCNCVNNGIGCETANVCLVCGDKGMVEHLIFCTKCPDSAAHLYCLGFSTDDANINWPCWECAANNTNAEPMRKSTRIFTKQQNALNNRGYWKHRLNQKKCFGKSKENHLRTADVETQNDIPKERMSGSQISNHSHVCNASITLDEPTRKRETTLPSIDESSPESFEGTQKTQDVGKRNRTLGENNCTEHQEEHKAVDLQILPLAACTASGLLHSQNSLEHDHCFNAEPLIDPIWRGLFNIGEGTVPCIEILGHMSNKACRKAFDAATAIPYVLNIQVMDKQAVWPNCFRALPPTTACIALYFFPAFQRVERSFDGLLDEIIERDLALKAVTPDAELLIFSSRELPLQYWRFHRKYYLWGVFRPLQRSRFPHDSDILTNQ